MLMEVMPIVEPVTATAAWADFASTVVGAGQPGS
jgi:hypothetical protein